MTTAERVALRTTVRLSAPSGRRVSAAVMLAAASVVFGSALLGVSGALISKAALRPPVLSLGVLIVTVRAFALVRALSRYGERLTSHDVALRSLATLRSAFFARLAAAPVASAPRRGQADLLSRFVADVDRLQDLYLRALTPWASAATCVIVTTAAAAIVLPAAAAVLLGGLLLAGVAVPWGAARLGSAAARRQATARAALSGTVLAAARHGAELAVMGQAPAWEGRLRAQDEDLARIARRDALTTSLMGAAGQLVHGATLIGVLLVSIGPVASGRLDGILLAALALVTLGAFEAVAPLPAAAVAVGACAAAAERVTAVADAPQAEPVASVPLPAGRTVTVRDLVVAGDDGSPPVLGPVSLRLERGECVAIIGPSGAGKTTLAEALVGLRPSVAGTITLGGADVRDLGIHDLRRTVRLIAQDAGLFTTTIAENVRLARPDASNADVRRSLDAVGLGPWLDTLPAGINTPVGEDGETVSGGERRRIALARGLVADADVLIVDEPTAHLDPGTAQLVTDALLTRAHARAATLVAIVHPGVSLDGFDRVLELRGGLLAPSDH